MTNIREWLEDKGLGKYADSFADNEIDFDVLPTLTEGDLEKLGLSVGARRRLALAVQTLGNGNAELKKARPSEPASAERRQLTVMFCDLVGSTQLSQRLDPEELRRLIRNYQDACAGAVARYDGYVAQFLGDGVLVYFGYPKAHEGEAERAIRAGLDIIERVSELSIEHKLQVRIGIDTGLVVIGQGDVLDEQERTAIGDAPNVAARLQSLAESGMLVISNRTRQVAGGSFDYHDLGTRKLKGIDEALHTWRVKGEKAVETRFDAATGGKTAAMIGRDLELNIALQTWQRGLNGHLQVLLICGEPGIGKSRIVRAIREHITGQGCLAWQYQCSPFFVNTALYPTIANMERALGFERNESAESKLNKLEVFLADRFERPDVDINLIGRLFNLPVEARYAALAMSPQKQKDETIRALNDLAYAQAIRVPLLLLFEDVHWADPTTLEQLDQAIKRTDMPAMLVLTYRPEFTPAWIGQPNVTRLTLARLDAEQTAQVATRVAGGRRLPNEIVEQIVDKTDGVPLFVEELTKAILETDMVKEENAKFVLTSPLTTLAIPATLHDSLMARLDRLAPTKEAAQIGACIGREFSYELLGLVSTQTKDQLDQAIEQLLVSELVYQRRRGKDTIYTFKHALVQDAAYESLLRTRRRELHAKIAHVIEERFPSVGEAEPEVLAHHYTEAGLKDEAIPLWFAAAAISFQRSALAETVDHAQRGLAIVLSNPESRERDALELNFQTLLGNVYTQLKGLTALETEVAFRRAAELCPSEPEPVKRIVALWGGWVVQEMSGKSNAALQSAREMERLAEDDRQASLIAHTALMDSLYWVGRYNEAKVEYSLAMELYRKEVDVELMKTLSFDMQLVDLLYASHFFWMLGYPDKALSCKRQMDDWDQELNIPFMTAFCKTWGARIFELRGDWNEFHAQVETAGRIAETYGFAWWNHHVSIWRGWLHCQDGNIKEGVRLLRAGMKGFELAGTEIWRPLLQPMLVIALASAGRISEAEETIDDSIEAAEKSGWNCSLSELERIRGEIMLSFDKRRETEAEKSFGKALDIAKTQHAKGWELRAAASYARLMKMQGRSDEARDLLKPSYDWFTEGFDTKDLKEAKALLEELEVTA